MVKEFMLQESNRIQELLDEAKRRGYITLDEVLEALPEAEEDLAQLEDLFAYLHDEGIEVYEGVEEVEEEPEGNVDLDEASDLDGITADDALRLYFKELSHVPLLSPEEEIELAKQMERGRAARRRLARNGHDPEERERLKRLIEEGEEARQHLIKANTRLVVSIAKRYRGHGVPFLDLIQEGNLGLMKAVDKFDYRQGNRLSTYATWWIRQAITRALPEQGRTIRIPLHIGERIRKLYRASRQLEQELERQPTVEEIAEEAGLEPNRVRWLLRISRRPRSLEEPVGEEKDVQLGSFIEDEDIPAPNDITDHSLLQEGIREVLTSLTPREARVLELRYGLRDGHSYTLKEVAKKFGLSRERIRQIEREALRKLRHPLRSRRLRAYLT